MHNTWQFAEERSTGSQLRMEPRQKMNEKELKIKTTTD